MLAKRLVATFGLLLVTLVVTGCINSSQFDAIESGSGNYLIINGAKVESGDPILKSTVMVFSKPKGAKVGSLCTGSLIHKNLVLTAGHCIVTTPGAKTVVLFGTEFLNPIEISANVWEADAQAIVHPEYLEIEKIMNIEPEERTEEERIRVLYEGHSDLALLRIDVPLPKGFEPAAILESTKILKKGSKIEVAGFGVTDAKNPKSNGVLFKAEISVMVKQINEGEILVNTKERGICYGDSGGPAFVKLGDKHYLFGVNSRTLDNKAGDYCKIAAAITDITKFEEWITETSEKLLSEQPAASPSPSPSPTAVQ